MEIKDNRMYEANKEMVYCLNNTQHQDDDAEYFINELTTDAKIALLNAIENDENYDLVIEHRDSHKASRPKTTEAPPFDLVKEGRTGKPKRHNQGH